MNAPVSLLQSPSRLCLVGLVLVAVCLPCGLSEETASSGKAPVSDKALADGKAPTDVKAPTIDKAPAEPVWYWFKSIDIPANNPIHTVKWDDNSPPDLMIAVERNGVKLGVSEDKEGWRCVYEKKYDNVFPFRQDSGETYTIIVFDYDLMDPNDNMLQIKVNGDIFNKDEVVVREKAEHFAGEESLVAMTFVRITNEERLRLQKAAGK